MVIDGNYMLGPVSKERIETVHNLKGLKKKISWIVSRSFDEPQKLRKQKDRKTVS